MRLRAIMMEMLGPVQKSLKDVSVGINRAQMEVMRQKNFLDAQSEWIKSLGDANQIEEKLNFKMQNIEKVFEQAHNYTTIQLGGLKTEFTLAKQEFHRNNEIALKVTKSNDLLQEEYCKLVATNNANLKTQRKVFENNYQKIQAVELKFERRIDVVEEFKQAIIANVNNFQTL